MNIKKCFLVGLAGVGLVVSLAMVSPVSAAGEEQKPTTKPASTTAPSEDFNEDGSSGFVICGNTVNTPCNVTHLFKAAVIIINYLIAVGGLVAILFIVFAGAQMVISQGETQLKMAKDRLNGALIGLFIIALAFVAVNSIFDGAINLGVRCGNFVLTDPAGYINGCVNVESDSAPIPEKPATTTPNTKPIPMPKPN